MIGKKSYVGVGMVVVNITLFRFKGDEGFKYSLHIHAEKSQLKATHPPFYLQNNMHMTA